jgi:hypothetical protein
MTGAGRASLKKTIVASSRWAPVRPLPDATEGNGASGKPRPARRLRWLAVALAASWLVPVVLHALGLDVVIFVVLLAAVASVLRSGTALLDRLMLAAGLLIGAVLAAGLVFSLWPWRLAPVPVGGTLLSVVALAGWAAGRKPGLPWRLLGSDALVAGSGVFAFLAARAPLSGQSLTQRLVQESITTDRFNHFALFDTIRRLGGYTFLHPAATGASLPDPMQTVYPSGSHFLYALIDTFLHPAGQPVPVLPEYGRYFTYVLVAYAFCVMAVVWAARWIAGPQQAGWRRTVVCAAAAGLALGGPLMQLVVLGQDPDLLSLAMLALLVAVTARPPLGRSEHVLIAGALLIAVTYTYSLYLPIAAATIAAGAVIYRRRLRTRWVFNVLAIAGAAGVALVPPAIALASGFSAQTLSLAAKGWMVSIPGPATAGLALLIAATMVLPAARRQPGWRAMVAVLFAAFAVTAGFAIYQVAESGGTGYYFGKLLLADYVICLAGVGALGTFLRAVPVTTRRGSRRRIRLWEGSVAAVLAAAVLILAVGFPSSVNPTGSNPVIWPHSSLSTWDGRQDVQYGIPSLAVLGRSRLLGDGVPTVVLSGGFLQELYGTQLAAIFNHDLGGMNALLQTIIAVQPDPSSRGKVRLSQVRQQIQETVGVSTVPLRLVVANARDAANARKALADYPVLRARVAHIVVVPGLLG